MITVSHFETFVEIHSLPVAFLLPLASVNVFYMLRNKYIALVGQNCKLSVVKRWFQTVSPDPETMTRPLHFEVTKE